MPSKRSAARWLAHISLVTAALLGLRLFVIGILTQARRLSLDWQHGLGFADPACTTGYCDYAMFWLAGCLARHGAGGILYDHARYAAAAAEILPYRTGYWPFLYPPTILVLAGPISLVALAPGYYVFSTLCTVASVWLLRRSGIAWWCLLVGLCGPEAMWNLYLGQIGLLCGALLVAGLARLETQPARAGACFALLCLKPQYALLTPVVMLAGRHWRAVMAAAVTGVGLIALSFACHGDALWRAYAGPGRVAMAAMLAPPFADNPMDGAVSVFWMLRSCHASFAVAMAGQVLAACLAAGAAWRLWRGPGAQPWQRLVVTVCLSYFVPPYGFNDDLAILAILLPTLACRDTHWRNALLAWLWLLPAYVPRFVDHYGFLPTPLFILTATLLAAIPSPPSGCRWSGARSGPVVPRRSADARSAPPSAPPSRYSALS